MSGVGETNIVVYSPNGHPITDLGVEARWAHVLNEIGDATLFVPKTVWNFKEEFLQFGNIVLIQNTELESWVGFMDSAGGQNWNDGWIEMNCVSAEKIFDWRVVPPFPNRAPAGRIFKDLVDGMNAVPGALQIVQGSIYMGGRQTLYPPVGRATEVLAHVLKKTKGDYNITPYINDNNRLSLVANLYAEKGVETGIALTTANTRLTEPQMVIEGEIWNHVIFMTPPSDSGQILYSDPQIDWESVGKFGLRMYLGEGGAEDTDTLNLYAKKFLVENAWPKKNLSPDMINVGSLYKHVTTGNIYTWENHTVGFVNNGIGASEPVKLMGYEVQTADGTLTSVVQSAAKIKTLREIWAEL